MNNLITSLLIFINNPEVRDTDYQIASCLLSHCHDIRHMTIQELAEKSYVSVSTINRFLKIFGFSRYSIFKEVLNQHVHVRYSQMMERLSEQMPNQVESLLQAVLSEVLNRTLYQRKIKKNCKIKKPMDGALCRIQLHNVPSFIWLYRSYGL